MAQVLRMMFLSGGAVVIAGILLGRSADQIADSTGLGAMWTGWVLLAAATSLPEFVTDVSAVRLHAANLAAGDLFGSSLTNMAILPVLALTCRHQNGRSSAPGYSDRGRAYPLAIPYNAWLVASASFSKPNIAEYLRPTTCAITKLRLIPASPIAFTRA
jgi:Ca2+/Na+ antiporter